MAGTSFGVSSGSSEVSLGSEAWNIADGYTKIKILKLLIEIDLYETIALFGYKDLDDPIATKQYIPYRRVEGIQRVLFCLKQLVGNCEFAIRVKADKTRVKKIIERIENIEKFMDGICDETYNALTKEVELKVNEKHFNNIFNILRQLKDELNFPINKAGLIFKQSDEMDLDKMMQGIVEGG